MGNLTGIYFLIGILYTIVNCLVRKMNTDEEYLIIFIWVFFWPICFICIGLHFLGKLKNTKV